MLRGKPSGRHSQAVDALLQCALVGGGDVAEAVAEDGLLVGHGAFPLAKDAAQPMGDVKKALADVFTLSDVFLQIKQPKRQEPPILNPRRFLTANRRMSDLYCALRIWFALRVFD